MTNMISSKWLWLAVTAAILVWGELSAPVDVADRVGYMLRVTARLAFALLLIAYLARPLKQLGVEGTALRWVLRNRRQVGLSMALAHTVHFGYVVAYLQVSGEPLAVVTALFGGAAFVLMWLMAATSNNWSVAQLGHYWKRLHTVGLHYLWLIFMQTFLSRALTGDPLYVGLIIAGLLALGLRSFAWLKRRKNQPSRTA